MRPRHSPGLMVMMAMAVSLTLKPVPAKAQAPAPPPEPLEASNARIHFGPLYVSPTLQIKELGVDTNVFNTTEDPKSDFTATLSPGARALMNLSRRFVVTGSGALDLVYYATYASQRSINGNYDVRLDAKLNRATLFVSDDLINTRDRPTYEFDIRPRHTEHSTRAGADFKLHDKLSLEVSDREAQLRYDPTAEVGGAFIGRSLDYDSHSLAADAKYRLTPYTSLTMHGDSTHDRFVDDQTRNNNSYSIEPGVTFSPRALISGTAAVGYKHFEALGANVPNYSGLVASAGLSYRLNGATIFNATVDRGLNYSYEPLTPYYVHTDVALTLRRQLVGRFDATATALHANYDYKGLIAGGITVPGDDREDTTVSYLFDIGYRASRKARIGFGVESWHRNSNQRSDRDYTGFRFRSTATVAF